MTLQDLVRTDLVTAPPEASASAAVDLLETHNVGSVLVVEDDRPVGIVTDRDLALRVIGQGLDPAETALEALMSSPVETVGQDAGLVEALDALTEHGVRRLPVVDAHGQLTGLVTLDDILTLLVVEFSLLEGVLNAQAKVGSTQG